VHGEVRSHGRAYSTSLTNRNWLFSIGWSKLPIFSFVRQVDGSVPIFDRGNWVTCCIYESLFFNDTHHLSSSTTPNYGLPIVHMVPPHPGSVMQSLVFSAISHQHFKLRVMSQSLQLLCRQTGNGQKIQKIRPFFYFIGSWPVRVSGFGR